MKNIDKIRWLLVATTVTTLALSAGCSDSEEGNPSPGTNVIGGSKGDGGSGGSKAGNTGKAGSSNGEGGNDPGTAGNGNTGNEGGGGPTPGGGGEGGLPPDECTLEPLGEDGCFNCPETHLQYLNRCAEGDCVAFDNGRLTKLNADGSLPPLN